MLLVFYKYVLNNEEELRAFALLNISMADLILIVFRLGMS
jgi:hypothetical protein